MDFGRLHSLATFRQQTIDNELTIALFLYQKRDLNIKDGPCTSQRRSQQAVLPLVTLRHCFVLQVP
jgi:hypothetical protein